MTTKKSTVAARELQQARKKRRHREVIRNRIIFGIVCAAVLALIIFLIVKLVSSISNSGQGAEASTLTFNSDGTVTFEEITDFNEESYSEKEFKDFTKDLISSFNEAYGQSAITLEKLKVKNNNIYVKTVYDSADVYSAFTSYPVFMGDLESCVEAGYDFESIINSVSDGIEGEAIEFESPDFFAGYEIAVVKENIRVVVPGTIAYVSAHSTTLTSDNTVEISQIDGNQDTTEYVYIIFEKDEK